ncbi:MAG: hypothetical protein HY821_03165 [Acidobacteria bacterium]|nr:hypothetical protein [Acidobacteriota bacterium]
MSIRSKMTLILALVMLFTLHLSAQSNTANPQLQVVVGPEASISVGSSLYTFSLTGTVFNNYTLNLPFTFKVRTTKSGGSGSLTATFAADFSAADGGTGPSISGGDLTYSSSTALAGVTTQSNKTAGVSTAFNVFTFGANLHSANSGTSGSIDWTLANKPTFETDTYTATVVLTISAS